MMILGRPGNAVAAGAARCDARSIWVKIMKFVLKTRNLYQKRWIFHWKRWMFAAHKRTCTRRSWTRTIIPPVVSRGISRSVARWSTKNDRFHAENDRFHTENDEFQDESELKVRHDEFRHRGRRSRWQHAAIIIIIIIHRPPWIKYLLLITLVILLILQTYTSVCKMMHYWCMRKR